MIQAREFIEPAKALGFRFWSGVPCSFLTPFINAVIDDAEMRYISSANEGDAVATATGAALAGQPAVAMMQNSGLGNAVSPLSSLNWVFRIPILLIVTLRGEPGLPDEPQHELMGQITGRLLEELQIPWVHFPRNAEDIEGALTVALWNMEKTGRPYAFVMRKGSVAATELQSRWQPVARASAYAGPCFAAGDAHLTRTQALKSVIESTAEERSIVIGTTGYTGRELFALSDRPNHLYMVGSMGCASSLGLGLSLALPDWKIVVVDGDGAALMRLGNLATIGAYGEPNFRHIVLDNTVHESTGGQSTVSQSSSFAGMAAACGYRYAEEAVSAEALSSFLSCPEGPSLQHLKILRGVADGLPRPDIAPSAVCRRLMKHVGIEARWAAA